MLVPRAFWRPVGRAVGRAAPRAMTAYYRAVARSYISALRRTPGLRAVYTYSSFVGGNFRPGESDVDFVAVTDAPTVAAEVDLLLRLRGAYRRHQSLLPIDVWEIPEAEFDDTAAWVTAMRPRAAEERPMRAVPDWLLLSGEDVRTNGVRSPDARLTAVGDYFVRNALKYVATRRHPAIKLAYYLSSLERDLLREGVRGPWLEDLCRSRAQLARGVSRREVLESAIDATLRAVDEHRRRHAVPHERTLAPGSDWRIPSASDTEVAAAERLLRTLGREAGASLRSATIYTPPLKGGAVLLLECADGAGALPLVRWAVGAARPALHAGLTLDLLTTRLAEDSWRSKLVAAAIVGGGRPLVGEPLAPRLMLPHPRWESQLAHYGGFWGATTIRWAVLRHRRYPRDVGRVFELAAERRLAAGEPTILDAAVLMREVPELRALGSEDPAVVAALDDAGWGRLGLEIWRGWPPLES